MSKKPTYEELERRIQTLEQEVAAKEKFQVRYEHIFANSLELTAAGRLDGRITQINPAFEQTLGYSIDDILEQPFLNFVHEHDTEKTQKALSIVAKTGTGLYVDNRSKCKDGTYKWIEWLLLSSVDKNYFFAIGRDISDRKLAEEALHKSEERFKIAGQAAYDLIYEWNTQTDSLDWIGDIDAILGFEPGVISRDIVAWLELIHPDDRGLLENAVDHHRTSTDPIEYAYRIKQSDGTYRFWNDHALPLLDEKNRPVRWIGVCTDITEKKRAETALQVSEEKYRSLVERTPDLLYQTDLQGKVTFISPSVFRLTGYTEEESIGMELAPEVYANPEEREQFLEMLKRDGEVHNFEAQLRKKDGSIWWASTNSHFLRDQDGKIQGVEGITRDVTEEKEAEAQRQKLKAQLFRQDKMESLGIMAGGIAHDLNNILQGIVSYPDLILLSMAEDDPLRKPLEVIRDSGQRSADIVTDLLTIARGVATRTEVVNLTTLAREFFDSGEYLLVEKSYPAIAFEKKLYENLLNTKCSPSHIKKTLTNLVLNAAEAITGEGKITISTENLYLDKPLRGYENVNQGEYILLKIADDGVGIAQADLERIFEPFYTKKVMGKSGTGLGLAVVWNTVHDHGGYISVSSNDHGTVFELYFPVSRSDLPSPEWDSPLENYQGNGEVVLIVDDQENQREIASTLLDRLGYQTETVGSGEQAIDFLKSRPVDLIVLDMIMDPGMDGLETYRQIVKLHPGQKAIIVSGYSENSNVKEAQRIGAGAYVKKPYLLAAIGRAVKAELNK